METLTLLLGGFEQALTPTNLALAVLGSILGTVIGALPGLGPSNGVAILIPLAFAFGLDPTPALILMTSVALMCAMLRADSTMPLLLLAFGATAAGIGYDLRRRMRGAGEGAVIGLVIGLSAYPWLRQSGAAIGFVIGLAVFVWLSQPVVRDG